VVGPIKLPSRWVAGTGRGVDFRHKAVAQGEKEVRPGNLWVELGSSLALSEEAVEFTAGGVEGALVVFRAIMNERSAILMDHAM
jgi:hypothetical protein